MARVGAVGDRVEQERGPRLGHVDRAIGLRDRTDRHGAAAVADVGMIDEVGEDAGVLQNRVIVVIVLVVAEDQAAPIAGGGQQQPLIVHFADGLVEVRGEIDAFGGSAQHLEHAQAAIDPLGIAAHVDIGGAQLDHRAGVDHHRHALRHVQTGAVGKRRAGGRVVADLVGDVVLKGVRKRRVAGVETHHRTGQLDRSTA